MSRPSSKPSHTGHLVPESPTHFYHRIPGLFGKPIGVLSLLSSSLPPPPLVWIPHSIFIWVLMGTLVSRTHTHTPQNTCKYLFKWCVASPTFMRIAHTRLYFYTALVKNLIDTMHSLQPLTQTTTTLIVTLKPSLDAQTVVCRGVMQNYYVSGHFSTALQSNEIQYNCSIFMMPTCIMFCYLTLS